MTPACRQATPADAGAAFQDWPLVSKLELAPFPSAVPCARLHARLILREWHLSQVADDAEIIVSELATNAIKATSDPIVLYLKSDRDALVIEVQDASSEAPQPRPHALDAESGRGLELVTMLSNRWGVHHPETGGKAIWAVLLLADPRRP